MKGSEFLRRVRDAGRRNGVVVALAPHRGKGSHVTLYYGARFTILKDRKKDVSPGLLHKMLKDLGLDRADIGLYAGKD